MFFMLLKCICMAFFIQMPKLMGTNCCFCISEGNVWADNINDSAVDFIAA